MRKAIILAGGIALVATTAFGQSSWRERDDDDRRGWREDRRESRDRGEMRDRSMRDDDGAGRTGAARFFVRNGEARMAVRCDDRESMRACVDATLTLFDRIRTQQAAPSGSTPSASPGSSSSPPPSSTPTPAR